MEKITRLAHFKLYFVLIFSMVLIPSSLFASSVYIDSTHSEFFVGDTVLFSVRIDTENKNINTVEGKVLLDHAIDTVSLTSINTSGSKFSLWPSKPLPSERNTHIYFAGGSPGGLTSKNAVVFNFVLKLQKEGQVALSPNNIEVYLNDGKGTKDKTSIKNLIIDVLPKKSDSQFVDGWSNLVSNDKIPPEPFTIYLGQENSVYDGKKFLSFSTTDEQSGIAYYEVIEGSLPPVRSNDTYILREQNKSVKVVITAYDTALNTRQSVYNPTPTKSYFPIIVFVVIILIIVLIISTIKKIRSVKNEFAKK